MRIIAPVQTARSEAINYRLNVGDDWADHEMTWYSQKFVVRLENQRRYLVEVDTEFESKDPRIHYVENGPIPNMFLTTGTVRGDRVFDSMFGYTGGRTNVIVNTWSRDVNAGEYFIYVDAANTFDEAVEDYRIRVRDVTGDSTVVAAAGLPDVAHHRPEHPTGTVTAVAEPEPLAASFYEPPESHGGSAFTMLLGFTEEFPLTEATLRANLAVSGGQLTTVAQEEPGRTRNWNVTITPAQFQTVTITLPATTDCSAVNAICTQADKRLYENFTLSVPHYTIPRVAGVTVTSGPDSAGVWQADDNATIEVQFNKAVTVSGLPDHEPTLGILVGGTRREATYVDGSSTDTLTFTHRVSADDAGTTTIEVVDNGISLGETGIADTHSQNAVLTFKFHTQLSSTAPPIRALFRSLPSSHDESSFTFELAFSEEPTEFNSRILQGDDENPSVLNVTNGTVDRVTRLEAGQDRRWEVVITPSGSDPVTITLPGSNNCRSVNSICRNARPLANPVTATVRGPAAVNADATGAPSITGTAALGQTLTADTSAIADDNGMTGAEFTYQWIRVHNDTETLISGATGSTYTTTLDDTGRDVKVQVSFIDDQYNNETVTSAAVNVPALAPLTAEFRNIPANGHDGSNVFNIRVAFNYPIVTPWQDLENHSFTVNGGTITRVNHVDGESDRWLLIVQPSGNDDVVISLTPNRACDTSGAICNSHGMMLSNEQEANISGPGTITAETPLTAELQGAPDSHNGSETFTFRILFSEAVHVGYATLKQHAFQVSNATIEKAQRVDRRHDLRMFTVRPSSDDAVVLVLPATGDCAAEGAICTGSGKRLSTRLEISVPGPAPANSAATGAPTISGKLEVGQTLTASTSGISDADGLTNAAFSYQWLANDTGISGATVNTYTLSDDDVGRNIKIRVSFTDDGDNDETLTSAATATVEARPNAPATGAPTITGTAQVGETLTANTSGITDSDGTDNATFAYQWLADDITISETTGSIYTLTDGDEGKAIKVRVSFTDDAGNDETLTSAATGAVSPSDQQESEPTTEPTDRPHGLSASASASTVTLNWNAPDDAGNVYTYRILRHRPEEGEPEPLVYVEYTQSTATSYADTAVEPGVLYVYQVQAADFVGLVGQASDPTSVRVPESNSPATGAPAISGTAQVGETLAAGTSSITDADGLDNVAYSHQWLADDTDISGATGASYTLVDADEGKAIKVRVSFTDDEGNPETLTSAATSTVSPAPTVLTARFPDTPSSHDGQTAFTFELRFSEELELSYKTLRDHAFTVTGGAVTKARRLEQGSNIRWEITVAPDGNGELTVVLPATGHCDDQGAICTGDGRKLSSELDFTVSGPGG